MKAVIWNGIGDLKLVDVDEPSIEDVGDAIIRITGSAICGTDLHMVRGTMAGMKKGTILGHEAIGIVESIGPSVKQFAPGDKVVVCSTIACGRCKFCEAEEYSSCDNANPMGAEAGTAFFGGPSVTGSFNGLQAEKARIPFADFTLVKIPDGIADEDSLICSDIFPTSFQSAEMADVKKGDIVAVFGCGPVGQLAIASTKLLGAKQVFAIDSKLDRLALAETQGAIPINFDKVDPVQALKAQTFGFGPDSCIDAVGVDAEGPHSGPAKVSSIMETAQNLIDQKMVAPQTVAFGDQFRQGDAPSKVLTWCVEAVRKSGVISIIGVYPPTARFFPIGMAMQKALTIRAANCSHRKYIPRLFKLMQETGFKPSLIISKEEKLEDAISCYKHFDHRDQGWTKVRLLTPAS